MGAILILQYWGANFEKKRERKNFKISITLLKHDSPEEGKRGGLKTLQITFFSPISTMLGTDLSAFPIPKTFGEKSLAIEFSVILSFLIGPKKT